MLESLACLSTATRRRSERGNSTREEIIRQANTLSTHLNDEAACGFAEVLM